VPEECRQATAEGKLMAKSDDGWQPFSRRMLPSSIRHAARGPVLCALCLCASCGTTGLAWVDEAHVDLARRHTVNAANVSASGEITSASIPAPAEQNSIEPRPRLNHTVTLGEIDVVSARDGVGPLAAAGPSVIVNNYNQVNVVTPTFGYGTLGYSHFSPGRVTVDPSRTSPIAPLPGQNWPALADHGPSFPYGSLPASPWTRSR